MREVHMEMEFVLKRGQPFTSLVDVVLLLELRVEPRVGPAAEGAEDGLDGALAAAALLGGAAQALLLLLHPLPVLRRRSVNHVGHLFLSLSH